MFTSSPLEVEAAAMGEVTVLFARGVLDGTTYLALRNAVIKAAIEEPVAVLVDVSALMVPAPSSWVVFLSAHWHVDAWRSVPIAVVSTDASHRVEMHRNGLHRYLAVHPTTSAALAATGSTRPDRRRRRRACTDLPPTVANVRQAQRFVADRLTDWSRTEVVRAAHVVTAVLVDNAVRHTRDRLMLRVETGPDTVTIAVSDTSTALAAVPDASHVGGGWSGLQIMATLCRSWGNAPTNAGKTVWAVIGPENEL